MNDYSWLWEKLAYWSDVAPVFNFVLIVVVLIGLLRVYSRTRK